MKETKEGKTNIEGSKDKINKELSEERNDFV